MNFVKMQGAGNDYVYVNCFEEVVPNPSEVAKKVSDRHFGIGSDGLVLILPSEIADVRMQMFNADGSEGNMCGNAIRCVGKYVYDNGIVSKKEITVETKTGIKQLVLSTINDKVNTVTVNMGAADLVTKNIPVITPFETFINQPVMVDGKQYHITCVSMGNPHAVTFLTNIYDLDLEKIGPFFEKHTMFPERINTEFVEIIDHENIKMRVFERGAGETWACGTGACAAVVAAKINGLCGSKVNVELRGGNLDIELKDGFVFMTGEAVLVFKGEIEI